MQDSGDDKLELKALTASITVLLTVVLVFGGCMLGDDGPGGNARAVGASALDSDADVSNDARDDPHALNASHPDPLEARHSLSPPG